MATPSLAMIPSAIADSKVYSVLPNNGDGDFSFNRDSSATRIGQNGLIQTIGFFGSEEVTNGTFDTNSDWSVGSGWTISGGKANVNSTSLADMSQDIGSSTGKTYKITFEVSNYVSGSVKVLLGYGSTPVSPALTASANGIYEVEATPNVTNPQRLYISTQTATSNLSIDNISVKEVTGDQPRLNYDISNGVVQSCPSLLLEPASTNLITYSQDFSQSEWVKLGAGTGSAAVVTSNYATSPDGTQNASRLQCDLNGGGSSSLNQSLIYDIYTSSGNQTISIYIKSNNGQNQTIYLANTQTSGDTITVTSQWQRFSFSHSAATYVFAVGLRGRTGGAINDTADILIYGAQAEALSYATSYIPTNGSSQTRAAETCFGAGTSSTFNSTEGVLYAEISALANPTSQEVALCISEGQSGVNRLLIRMKTDGAIGMVLRVANTTEASINSGVLNQLSNHKVAVKWKVNDIALWIDGVEVGTDSSANVFSANTLDEVSFNQGNNSNQFYGKTKDIRVFNEALTDLQLQKLTTL